MLVMAGCRREEQPAPQQVVHAYPQIDEKEPHAAGKKVYNANKCARCHTMGAAQTEEPLPGSPPDLVMVASKPDRNVEWFIAYVSDASKFKPDTTMLAYGKILTPEELRSLAEFLASLK
jgi:mono/diheme cytochrome c family protein